MGTPDKYVMDMWDLLARDAVRSFVTFACNSPCFYILFLSDSLCESSSH